MAEIRSKRQFFELWRAGCLGNRPRLFTTFEEAAQSGAAEIGFREIGRAGGGAWEKVPMSRLGETHMRWTSAGRKFIMDDGVPNDRTTMQGELCRTERGLYGFFVVSPSRGLPPMRETMARGLHRSYYGAAVQYILGKYLDPSSQDDVRDLLDLYPDAVIELAAFDVNVGNLPGRNTVIWEVRNY